MKNNIYALRNNLGLTQAELAAKCQVTQQFIQLIESQRRTPSIQIAKRLASALECSIDDIFKDEKEKAS